MYSYETSNAAVYYLLKEFAKQNKQNPTPAEAYLWKFLQKGALGKPFRRQHIIDDFIADFVCLPSKTVIELDGGYHQLPKQQISDEERTKILNEKGFKVLRFTNDEIFGNITGVLQIIKESI